MNNSKTRQIIRFLGTGKDLTTSQIQNQFGISNVSSTMSASARSLSSTATGVWSTPLKNGNGQRFSIEANCSRQPYG